MTRLFDLLSIDEQRNLVTKHRPAEVAQWFDRYVGQFHDRRDFDRLARAVFDLYARVDENDAWTFRQRLDQRLYDRFHERVVWADTESRGQPER